MIANAHIPANAVRRFGFAEDAHLLALWEAMVPVGKIVAEMTAGGHAAETVIARLEAISAGARRADA